MDIIIKHTVSTNVDSSTPRRRTIYVARYTVEGERTEGEIDGLIEQGRERILSDYFDGKIYKNRKSWKNSMVKFTTEYFEIRW